MSDFKAETEQLFREARIANRRRTANTEKKQAALKAEAARILRGGHRKATPVQDALAAHRAQLKNSTRPN